MKQLFRSRLATVIVGISLVGSLGFTAAATASSKSTGASLPLKGKTVVLVTCAASQNPWCGGINTEFTKVMAAAGAKVIVLQDPQDPALQAQHMSQAIADKPAAIAVQADDPNGIVPSLVAAKKAHIPVINWNSTISAAGMKLVVTSVVADNAQLGTFAGENLVAGLKAAGYKKANILNITGTASLPLTPQRVNAFKAVLAKYPQYKVVATEDSNFDPNLAAQEATSVLSKWKSHGGIQGAWGMADFLALSIASSAKQLGISVGIKAGDLVTVGGNCTEPGVQAVISGELAGDGTQSPVPEAHVIADKTILILEHKKVPKIVEVSEARITPANAKQYLAQCTY